MNKNEDRRQKTPLDRFGIWFNSKLPFFYSNWVTTLGSLMAVVAVLLLLVALFMHIFLTFVDRPSNPYVDLIGFMVLPMLLIGGLLLVFLGAWINRRRKDKGERGTVAIEIGGPEFRRKVFISAVVGVVTLVLLSSFSYEAYHFTDSAEFCTNICHAVMEPEGVAYERSPHANVPCVKCHIGPGADWFVRAKLSGLRQVVAVVRDSYSRPIPAPVENLRPARETCEACHWPEKLHGSKMILREHFESDRDNTPSVTTLMVKVGGLHSPGLPSSGVHWHVDPRNEVRYRVLDHARQDIVEVIQKTEDGEVRYLREGADPESTEGEWRVMDCIDCHNRPTHIFEVPGQALDKAFLAGELDANIPWLRREAERALREVEPNHDTAGTIAAFLTDVYTDEHAEDLDALRSELSETATVLTDILERNVFPEMGIGWGTYASHLQHMDIDGEMADTGCFRCHDEEHVSEDGRYISQDCDQCHILMTEREEDMDALPDFVPVFLTRP
jgi:NapC/NirT cytochrome c family, N-terminal region